MTTVYFVVLGVKEAPFAGEERLLAALYEGGEAGEVGEVEAGALLTIIELS